MKSQRNPLFSALLLGLSIPACAMRAPFDGLAAGSQAPELGVERWTQAGEMSHHSLAKQQGRPVLLEFWSSECPPCLKSIPKMNWAADAYRDRLDVLAVHVDLDREQPISWSKLERFVREQGIQYPVGHDVDGEQWEKYRFHYLPHAVLIDSEGRVLWSGNLVAYDLEKRLRKFFGEPLSVRNEVTPQSLSALPGEDSSCEEGYCAPAATPSVNP
jgi:thiol-disulfide isomerase/thioredoxin